MSMSELARRSPQLNLRDFCQRRCQRWLEILCSSIFGTSAEIRCKSWLDVRSCSIFGTSAECRCQSWLDIRSSSIFGTSAECRCQSWLYIRPSVIFGTCAEYRCTSWLDIQGFLPDVDVRAGSTFAIALYSNVDVSATFTHLSIT
ncbi:hypothetical protein DPMN_101331 [Dreissena polymorpha]|uniref:Uncharacterized protein n=1 Tax=Dreissena polymorpha TaxID=45954 RepID=A0A9D4R9Z4_DREPO|nr:hypothetical protein DPMN_101331 [Dreissena polymorpha]